jgi:signal transduction histidine kinase
MACLLVWGFLSITQESPFQFSEKPFYRPVAVFAARGLPEMEAEQLRISKILDKLPQPNRPPTGGSTGYLSLPAEQGAIEVRLKWDEPQVIDAIAMVPSQNPSYINESWPLALPLRTEFLFLIDGLEVYRITFDADGLPGGKPRNTLPFFADFPPVTADTVLMRDVRVPNAPREISLSEIMVFSGKQNIAHSAQIASTSERTGIPGFSLKYLCDEQTPLGLPQTYDPGTEVGYKTKPHADAESSEEIWLRWQTPVLLDEIRLYPVEGTLGTSDPGAGMPRRVVVETRSGSQASWEPCVDTGKSIEITRGFNPIPIRFPEVECREMRMITTLLYKKPDGPAILALAEIEARHRNQPLALPGEPWTPDMFSSEKAPTLDGIERSWSLASLADGKTTFGKILGEREWMKLLAQQADLIVRQQISLPEIEALRKSGDRLCWRLTLAIPFLVIVSLIAWQSITQTRNMQDARRIRDRLAADLHDDLGSNLSTIAKYAESLQSQPGHNARSVAALVRLTRDSVGSLKEMVSITAPRITRSQNLITSLRNIAEIHCVGVTHDFEVEKSLETIDCSPLLRRNLRLFLKEALNNAVSHSGASHIAIRITRDDTGIPRLAIEDNGSGLPTGDEDDDIALSTLRIRAGDMGADFGAENAPGGGCRIRLGLPFV